MHDRSVYDTLVALHVVAALVSFGAIGLAGVYGGTARDTDRPGAMEEAARYFAGRDIGEWAIASVPILGVGAVLAGPGAAAFRSAWVVVAIVAWAAAAGIAFGVVAPTRRQLRDLLGEGGGPDGDPPAATVRQAATRLAAAGAACDVIFLVALVDMVVKPGS